MNDSTPTRRGWTCPDCGRVFQISSGGEGPERCPLCATPDEPERPSTARRVWNLATALAEFASDGFRMVEPDVYQARLTICDECAERRELTCRVCGCKIALKARGRAWRCPLGKWEEGAP